MVGKIRFGVYELDREAGELRKHGVLIRLQEQPFRVLAILAARPGEIVTRGELQEQIWGKDTFVDFDQSLNKAVNRVREALNDDAGTPQYIETVPRRGYRFVAPVTGNTSSEQYGTTGTFRADSDSELRRSGPSRSSFVRTAALAMAGISVALGIAGMALWRKPGKPALQQARHISSTGFAPVLSRDGKLLVYSSNLSDNVTHIWVQQTAGGEATPATSGPDADFLPDISPDGTHIAFVSTRRGGGVYVSSTFPGEPRLLVRGAFGSQVSTLRSPRFSPAGDEILYLENGSKAVIVPVDGGQPVPLDLNRDFLLLSRGGPPCWSPSGNEIIFFGVRKREAEKPGGWWIAPLKGGDPRPANLPGVGEHPEEFSAVHAWIRTKDNREWILYSVYNEDAWRLFRVAISARGQIGEKTEQLASGIGELGPIGHGASLSEDGKLVYSVNSFSDSIYEIPINDRGQQLGPILQLPLSGAWVERSPSVSRDGRWMAYNAIPPGKPSSILLRDLSRAANRFLDDKDSSPGFGVAPSISPDGSKLIFERDCNASGVPGADASSCGFMVSTAGGQPEQVCEFCTPRGFSSNGSVVLIQKYASSDNGQDRIVALDLATKAEKDFLSLPDKNLYHAFFSWDDRWVVFKKMLDPNTVQLLIAPVHNGVAGKEVEWIAVTDGRYSDDKPQFSPDGNTVYFTSTRDGYLCIWAQRLDPRTKRPLGDPVAYEHFHNSVGRDVSNRHTQVNSDLSVARDKILINLPEARHDVWMMQVE